MPKSFIEEVTKKRGSSHHTDFGKLFTESRVASDTNSSKNEKGTNKEEQNDKNLLMSELQQADENIQKLGPI